MEQDQSPEQTGGLQEKETSAVQEGQKQNPASGGSAPQLVPQEGEIKNNDRQPEPGANS